ELKRGDTAPAFSLEDDEGKTLSTKDLGGSRYVVYFYPKDDTPGCTTEACQFTENFPQFETLGVPVLGISRDDAKSHQAFRTTFGRGGASGSTRRPVTPSAWAYRFFCAASFLQVLASGRLSGSICDRCARRASSLSSTTSLTSMAASGFPKETRRRALGLCGS